jgi:hypothetical protein
MTPDKIVYIVKNGEYAEIYDEVEDVLYEEEVFVVNLDQLTIVKGSFKTLTPKYDFIPA